MFKCAAIVRCAGASVISSVTTPTRNEARFHALSNETRKQHRLCDIRDRDGTDRRQLEMCLKPQQSSAWLERVLSSQCHPPQDMKLDSTHYRTRYPSNTDYVVFATGTALRNLMWKIVLILSNSQLCWSECYQLSASSLKKCR